CSGGSGDGSGGEKPVTNINSNVKNTAGNNSASPAAANNNAVPTVSTYEIVNTYKHDSKAFTQGLVFHNGFLYESTGEYGDSTLRRVEAATGKVVQEHEVAKDYFAEGMTILNGKIYQITWRENTAFVYDVENFRLLREIKYQGSGWGLTTDGTHLIMSDGTHVIKFLDPETFNPVRSITVKKEDGAPVYHLNELEFVNGEIWANIWHSENNATQSEHGFLPNIGKPNYIARIAPDSGRVVGWIDLAGISPEDVKDSENTLNGIAYDAQNDRIFVTGKKWKRLFEIKLKPKQ
ncbi:MAG TPA: glutaminyl-peptide cyclotransferase, partial [Pyrinomonadaceae bacterium]|nr:glutaminyl-peptide cyclotransferase [Pyrinomonadaceae bacterium]